jgi:hypothetical protein
MIQLRCLLIISDKAAELSEYCVEVGLHNFLAYNLINGCLLLAKETIWSISNLCYHSQTASKLFYQVGIVKRCYNLMVKYSADAELLGDILSFLINVTFDDDATSYRDYIIEYKELIEFIINYLSKDDFNVEVLRSVLLLIYNLITSKINTKQIEIMYQLIPIAFKTLMLSDKTSIINSLNAISRFTIYASIDYLDLYSTAILKRLMELIKYPDQQIQICALNSIASATYFSDSLNKMMIELNLFELLKSIIKEVYEGKYKRKNEYLIKICFIISNLLASSQEFMQSILTNDFLEIIYKFIYEEDMEVKIEATWVLINAATLIQQTTKDLTECKMLDCLLMMLRNSNDTSFIISLLDSLHKLAQFKNKDITIKFEVSGGKQLLQKFDTHANPDIYQKANSILALLFEGDTYISDIEMQSDMKL